MAEGAGLHPGKIVGSNLPGHVHGDKALQTQHHLMEGAIHIVDHVQPQPLFQYHGHAEHPLFRKLGILRHFRHGKIAVHGHRAGAVGEHRGFEKVQLGIHQLRQPGIEPGGGKLNGRRGGFHLIKMDDPDVFIQIKFVHFLQEAIHISGTLRGTACA